MESIQVSNRKNLVEICVKDVTLVFGLFTAVTPVLNLLGVYWM